MKQNLREILENKCRDTTDNGLDKLIAIEIINELNQGIKPNINTVAEKTFTNKSSISRFAKKNGFEGYKQFVELLWIEEGTYYKNGIENNKNEDDHLLLISNDIENHKNDLALFSNLLNNSNDIYIFNSYQNEDVAELFASNLQSMGKKVVFVKNTYKQQLSSFVSKDSVIIYLVSGTDNWTMQKVYDNTKTITNNQVIIGTKSQTKKFKDPYLLFEFQTPDVLFREVYKKMWFISFISKSLTMLSELDNEYKKNILNPQFKY